MVQPLKQVASRRPSQLVRRSACRRDRQDDAVSSGKIDDTCPIGFYKSIGNNMHKGHTDRP
jgi:hypothetical protein